MHMRQQHMGVAKVICVLVVEPCGGLIRAAILTVPFSSVKVFQAAA